MKNRIKNIIPLLLVFIVLLVGSCEPSIAQDSIIVGKISAVSNAEKGVLIHNGAETPISLSRPVYLGDTLKTGNDGKVALLLNDNSVFALDSNTEITVDEFVFDEKDANVNLRVKTGLVAGITGDIVKRNPEKFKVTTPKTILGIRGTTFFTDVEPNKPELAGVINIEGGHSLDVNGYELSHNLTAVAVHSKEEAPIQVPIPSSIISRIANSVPLSSNTSELTFLFDYNKEHLLYQKLTSAKRQLACTDNQVYFQSSASEVFTLSSYSDNMCKHLVDSVLIKLEDGGVNIVNELHLTKMNDRDYPFQVKYNGTEYQAIHVGVPVKDHVGAYYASAKDPNGKEIYGYVMVYYTYSKEGLQVHGKAYLSKQKARYSDKLFENTNDTLKRTQNSTFDTFEYIIK